MKITCKSATIGIIIGILIVFIIKYGIIFGLCCLLTWLVSKAITGFMFSLLWPTIATLLCLIISLLTPAKGGNGK